MTRPHSRQPPIRPNSKSSSSSTSNRFDVFDFDDTEECRVEVADAEYMKKFFDPEIKRKRKRKKKKSEEREVSPAKKYAFQEFSSGIHEVIDIDAQKGRSKSMEDVSNKEVPVRDTVLSSGSSINKDTSNKKVSVCPDFVLCGDKHCKGAQLIFSSKGVELNGSILNGPGSNINFHWTIGAIISVESTWCQRVETAIVKICFKSADRVGTENADGISGIRELTFSVYDPHWFDREESIKSLDVYKDIWRVIFDIDAEEAEDSLPRSNDLCLSEEHHINLGPQETFEVVYPKGKPEAVAVTKRDLELLQPETFINDTIIDFYIQFLKSKIQPEEQHRFYFFNCFFFKKLVGLDNNPSTVGQGREAFQRVQKWTKDVNLFQKDYIFIPVNYSLHWSLIVICHPGEVINLQDEEVKEVHKVPCILHMDSIRGSHRGLRNIFQTYLCELWKDMHGTTEEYVSSNLLQLPFVSLEVPQQENSFDCGLFVLHYVEQFLKEVPDDFNPFVETKSSKFLKRNWFPPREASLKREQILNLVYHIHETDSQRAADCSCRCPCPSQIDDANKTENDVEILEKQGISARKSYGDSSLDTDCQKDVLPLADSQSKGSCLDGNLKGRPRKGRKSNLLLDIEEDELGDQVDDSTDVEDCQLVDLPHYVSSCMKGEDRQQSQRTDEVSQLKGMEGTSSAMDILETAACIVEDSQDNDGMNEDIADSVAKDSQDDDSKCNFVEDSQNDDCMDEDIADCVVKDSQDDDTIRNDITACVEDSQDDDGVDRDTADCMVTSSNNENSTHHSIGDCVSGDSEDEDGMQCSSKTKRSRSLFRGSATPPQEVFSSEIIDLTDETTHKSRDDLQQAVKIPKVRSAGLGHST